MAPPGDQKDKNKRIGCYPPLGILQLATVVKKIAPEVEVRIRDPPFNEREIAKTVETFCDENTLVGFSVLVTNYNSSVRLGELAKDCGSTVLFGNEQASVQPVTVLTNRTFVDGVIVRDGKSFIKSVFSGEEWKGLDNLYYRDGTEIVAPSRIKLDGMDGWPTTDRSLIDQTPYWENFNERFVTDIRVANTNFAPGCGWARCLYCSMEDLRLRHVSVEKALEELAYLRNNFGIRGIFETSDNLTSFLAENNKRRNDFLRQLAARRSEFADMEFYVCGRSSDLTLETVRILKELGVDRVSMGMDSGQQQMLDGLNKGEKIEDHFGALELLQNNGMMAFLSFVLGSPGETEETLQETIDHIDRLVKTGAVRILKASPLIPLKGSRAWRKMMAIDTLKSKYEGDDCPEPIEVATDWAKHFCKVTYEQLLEATSKILGAKTQVKGMYLD